MKLSELLDLGSDEIRIWSVVPLRRHPQSDEIDQASLAWSIEHGLCTGDDPITRSRMGGVLADCIPFARPEVAYAYACYGYWSMFWDDYLDDLATDPVELGRHIAEAVHVAIEPLAAMTTDSKWLISLHDVCRLLSEGLGPAGYERVAAAHALWFTGQLWKEMQVHSSTPPSVGEVLRMRLLKAGFRSVYAITTSGSGNHMTPEEYADPCVQAFGQSAYMAAALLNEITSLPKELSTGSAAANLVSAIALEHGLDLPAAVKQTWELYERMGCLALALQQQLLKDPRPHVATFATHMPQWIPSSLQFHTMAPRYLELPNGGGTLEVPPRHPVGYTGPVGSG
ncbi:terpene synthase family protein [Streptomyces sp. NPDC050485]|uniref:terpene synthase family protein n=1 Tax=Streptomyces sp. NPDC050485 TaxID=3365617 RepID=UPI0037A517DF